MQKFISELRRLYLIDASQPTAAALERHARGEATLSVDLADANGQARTLLLAFHRTGDGRHWQRLCDVANALQQDLALPAPAVSVSGGTSYGLWLSLETPVPTERLRQFHALLHKAYCADDGVELGNTVVEPPPHLNRATGLWAAFINPGMGASFAEELGLEMSPPLAAQTGFLEGLRSISAKEFDHAFALLEARHENQPDTGQAAPAASAASVPRIQASTTPAGLLLKDATLEDIVRLLHERRIEPTFRHLLD